MGDCLLLSSYYVCTSLIVFFFRVNTFNTFKGCILNDLSTILFSRNSGHSPDGLPQVLMAKFFPTPLKIFWFKESSPRFRSSLDRPRTRALSSTDSPSTPSTMVSMMITSLTTSCPAYFLLFLVSTPSFTH